MGTTRSGSKATRTTVWTDADPGAFIEGVTHEVRRRDARTMLELMQRVSGEAPRMWGPSIVGFGSHHYVLESGREGDIGAIGFSPRTTSTTVYFTEGFDRYTDELARLGPHTLGRSCLYLTDLSKVDLGVLEEMVRRSYAVRSYAVTTGRVEASPAD
jgi:hypothetical protein